MPDQKKKGHPQNKKDEKPWEKMNGGKTASHTEKAVPKDFLYLLPKKTSAKEMAKAISFLPKDSVEVWEEECVIEITTKQGIITFEDIQDSLEKEDEVVLSGLGMKRVIACDYESTSAEMVRKIMVAFLDKFGGRIGTDTEDFMPFLTVEEL